MAVEDILKKITSDFQNKREEMLFEAETEKKKIIKKAEEDAEVIFKEIISEIEESVREEAERRIISERLKFQKEILSLKRQILDDIFRRVKEVFPLEKVKKRVITPSKELEEDLEMEEFLEEVRPRLEIEASKILWP